LVGYEVGVFSIETGSLVTMGYTDARGLCYFNLTAFEYTSAQVNYEGSYHFISSSPDRRTTKKVRGEIQGPTQIRSVINIHVHPVQIYIEEPVEDTEYSLSIMEGDHLETYGFMVTDGGALTAVYVQLVPEGDKVIDWPMYELGFSPVPLEDLPDQEDRWGKFFPPDQNSNKYPFFFKFPMANDDVEYFSGNWVYRVIVADGTNIYNATIEFDLLFDVNRERPWVLLYTTIHGEIFNGSVVPIRGTAVHDYQNQSVEVRIDSGLWEVFSTAEEWTYDLNTTAVGEGQHTIDFRAYDGMDYSNVNANSFEVIFDAAPPPNGGGNGDPGWDTQMYLIAGGTILLVIAIGLVLALVVVKRRSPPDSLGEG
jgi:hypothetical protein